MTGYCTTTTTSNCRQCTRVYCSTLPLMCTAPVSVELGDVGVGIRGGLSLGVDRLARGLGEARTEWFVTVPLSGEPPPWPAALARGPFCCDFQSGSEGSLAGPAVGRLQAPFVAIFSQGRRGHWQGPLWAAFVARVLGPRCPRSLSGPGLGRGDSDAPPAGPAEGHAAGSDSDRPHSSSGLRLNNCDEGPSKLQLW